MADHTLTIEPIATIRSGFSQKFGIPRQSGLSDTVARVIFTPAYRNPDALRGIEEFSHIWLIWGFSEAVREGFSPTVRPPRLGGNRRMGVFATRSPFRPNPLGLSSVRLLGVEKTEKEGLSLVVAGADLLDGTPIYDVKPYLPFTDAHPDALGGFADGVKEDALAVVFPEEYRQKVGEELAKVITSLLSQDPRPHYQDDPTRVYGFPYEGFEVRFTVQNGTLTVLSVEKEC